MKVEGKLPWFALPAIKIFKFLNAITEGILTLVLKNALSLLNHEEIKLKSNAFVKNATRRFKPKNIEKKQLFIAPDSALQKLEEGLCVEKNTLFGKVEPAKDPILLEKLSLKWSKNVGNVKSAEAKKTFKDITLNLTLAIHQDEQIQPTFKCCVRFAIPKNIPDWLNLFWLGTYTLNVPLGFTFFFWLFWLT